MPPTDGFTLEIEDATAQNEMQDDVPESEIEDATAQEEMQHDAADAELCPLSPLFSSKL